VAQPFLTNTSQVDPASLYTNGVITRDSRYLVIHTVSVGDTPASLVAVDLTMLNQTGITGDDIIGWKVNTTDFNFGSSGVESEYLECDGTRPLARHKNPKSHCVAYWSVSGSSLIFADERIVMSISRVVGSFRVEDGSIEWIFDTESTAPITDMSSIRPRSYDTRVMMANDNTHLYYLRCSSCLV
jgi:hypothetical protein